MGRLQNKTALVTGAAGGIGAAIAEACAAEGASVAIVDLNGDGARDVAERIENAGGRAIAFTADCTDDAAMRTVAEQAAATLGSIDAAFCNAGIPCMSPLEEIDKDLFQRVTTVNTYSVIATIKAVAPIMEKQPGRGRIVNTCSVAGKTAYPLHTLYAVTKFGIRALTQGLAKELADRGIAVNAICPGIIDTTLWDSIGTRMESEGSLDDSGDVVEVFSQGVLAGRPGTPQDMTGLAVFLASEDAAYINGQCINNDGGLVFD